MRADSKPFLLRREVLFGNVRVTGARKSVGGHRLFEGQMMDWPSNVTPPNCSGPRSSHVRSAIPLPEHRQRGHLFSRDRLDRISGPGPSAQTTPDYRDARAFALERRAQLARHARAG